MTIAGITPDKSASCARIAYANALVSSAQAPSALVNNTYQRYTPTTGSQTAKFQLSAAANVDYIAIGAHNLGTHDDGQTITLSYATTIGGALTEIDELTVTDNGAIFRTFDSISGVAEIAIETNATTEGLEIGIVYAGESMVMERPIYGGHNPIDLSQKTDYQNSMSDTGQFLGRTITKKGLEASFSWQYLTPAWYRSTFQPFVVSAVTNPFFIKWRPDQYEAAAFGYSTRDITPTNMSGGSGLMSVTVNMRAHSEL